MIQLKNVNYFDRGKQILSSVSLDIEDNQSLALLGTNGAGKSTVIDVLTGMLHPAQGTALINGQPFQKVKGSVGVLYEDTPYFYYMTVKEWLTYLCTIYGTSLQDIYPLIDALGLIGYLKKQFQVLSKGEKRKISILSTLMHNPDVLILDEPDSGLDPFIKNTVWKFFKERPRTILFTSHDWEDAELYADQIAFISDGKIIAIDTYRNFLSSRYLPATTKMVLRKGAVAEEMYQSLPHVVDQDNVSLYSEEIAHLREFVLTNKIEHTMIKTDLNDVYLILKYKIQYTCSDL